MAGDDGVGGGGELFFGIRRRPCETRHPGDPPRQRGAPTLCECRKDFVPQPIALAGEVVVRRVADGCGAVRDQRLRHFLATGVEHRSQDAGAVEARHRPHAAESARAGAAQQPQQDRLGLIFDGVSDGDRGGAGAACGARQQRVARLPRRLLESAGAAERPTARDSRSAPQHEARHADAGGECANASCVVARFAT